MSLEAHHRFILDTMQRNQDIARNIINELEAENARLKAEVERLRKAGDAMAKVIPDIMDYRFDGNECDKELKAWHAAKEASQA